MATPAAATTPLTATAYRGDAKTLLAFDLPKEHTANLAGFTIECQPEGGVPYYLGNSLRFEHPDDHAKVPGELPTSSANAPFHKFRWLHVPGSQHQGLTPFFGPYTYTVTPRYFDGAGHLQPLDPDLSRRLEDVIVAPFEQGAFRLGFTRGYVQSQGYVRRFGPTARIVPKGADLEFDTTQTAGTSPAGGSYTYRDEYEWLGFTARTMIQSLLDEVIGDTSLSLEVFAYDLNEPDIARTLLDLAAQGRVRIVLDSAALHRSTPTKRKPEDEFEASFNQMKTGASDIRRGHFSRYAHDKVLIAKDGAGVARTVLTGSTNFSTTGLYVNSNHVLRYDDRTVADVYARLFQAVWDGDVHRAAFLDSDLTTLDFQAKSASVPDTRITFAPHSKDRATAILQAIADRASAEDHAGKPVGNVLFAVMQTTGGGSPVYDMLNGLHANPRVFSYGVSDAPAGIFLYTRGSADGVLVTGKPLRSRLPAPFSKVPSIGLGHQIHHKFVVCGLGSDDPVVFCGSSNLALLGEQENGDNLIEVHDRDVVTAFAIEALALVDHFQFLNCMARDSEKEPKPPDPSRVRAAEAAEWFLGTTDRWARPYYDPADLHCIDRELFAGLAGGG